MNNQEKKKLKIAFFGTPNFAVTIFDILYQNGYVPSLVITNEDKPKGRKLLLTPPPVKVWAESKNLPIAQPKTLKDGALLSSLKNERWDLFIVAAYGKIIPKEIIDLPLHRTLNIHPSLLPLYRGASPIESQILNDEKDVGVSIMILDEEMDHGPILVQEKLSVSLPIRAGELEEKSAVLGGELLVEHLPDWINRNIQAKEQEHHKATYTKKITKEDGLIDLSGDPYQNYLKFCAYEGWPGTYFFTKEGDRAVRVIIKDAEYQNGSLVITRVIPEGKKEMSYRDFLKLSSNA